ncbi:MAG: ATP-binding protein [Gemmatimonadota bacterium]
MRYTPAFPPTAIQGIHGMLDPRRVMRWVWLGRVMLACAILVAAVFVWNRAEPNDTLIATLAFAIAVLATVGSVMWGEFQQRRPRGHAFYALQCCVDLALVTAVVHITGGWSSQFAALYILVIASGALLLPFRGGIAVAAGACLLYLAEVLWLRPGLPQVGMVVQLIVFVVVAVGSGYVAARLRQAGVGRDALAAELVKVQLEAADILRTIRSGILTIDGRGRLLYANPAAADLLGINLRAHVGRPVLPTLMTVSPHLVGFLEQSTREGIRTSRAEGLIRRDGEEIEIGVTTTVADGPEGAGGSTATAIFQDISDSKRLQALHVRAERLQAVAELSASLAHEIRNPLASIRSATEQLARRRTTSANSVDDEDERILHDLVVREADRLSRLLGDFLDFARARVTRIAALDIGAIVTAATTLAASHPDRGAGVVIDTKLAAGLPSIEGDEDLLHRAVFNLVLNAVQAVGESGHIVVDVQHRVMDGDAAHGALAMVGDVIAISVSDDGPGVSESVREHLFEPFVTGKAGGTGLGLPVVHRAVEAHRGIVIVDALSPGARFTVFLPLGDARKPRRPSGAPSPAVTAETTSNSFTDPSTTAADVARATAAADSRLIGAAQ